MLLSRTIKLQPNDSKTFTNRINVNFFTFLFQGEKYLVLKKKYRTPSLQSTEFFGSPVATPELNPSISMSSLYSLGDKRSMAHSTSQDSLDSATSPSRQPPPYRPPPPPVSSPPPPQSPEAPPVPPRKKSISSNKENSPEVLGRPTTIGAEADLDVSNFVHIESFKWRKCAS